MEGFTIPYGILNLFTVQKGSYSVVPEKYAFRPDLMLQDFYTEDADINKELCMDSFNNISNLSFTAGSVYHIMPLDIYNIFRTLYE